MPEIREYPSERWKVPEPLRHGLLGSTLGITRFSRAQHHDSGSRLARAQNADADGAHAR